MKVEEGVTRCPGCGASLIKTGTFMELIGWVVVIISSIPIIIGLKTLDQNYYLPMVIGGAVLVIGAVLIVLGRGKSRAAADTVKAPAPATRE
ncbi:MAG: hypothetical protein HY717_14805 [Planctomycetes bacterium]|nr:hypothetical protein [Planctomycetota bacterium]